MWSKDFDKKFDKQFEVASKLFIGAWIAGVILSLASIAGVVFVVYKILVHFGIL